MIARILQIVVGIAGLCALALGLSIWIANINVISIHVLFGILVTLGLLVMSILAVSPRGLRFLGIVGIVYAVIVPIFGVSQFNMLVGSLSDAVHAGRHRRNSADGHFRRPLHGAEKRG